MQRLKPGVDVVKDILELVIEAQPLSTFAKSLYQQYQERGGLSKKQLEGLMHKALKVSTIPENKIATLEAIILKKPNRYKSEKPAAVVLIEKDTDAEKKANEILEKYPQHKRVLFLKNRLNANFPLTATEKTELEKFYKVCCKK